MSSPPMKPNMPNAAVGKLLVGPSFPIFGDHGWKAVPCTFVAGERVLRHPFLGEATMATLSSMSRERIAYTLVNMDIQTYTLNMIKTKT